MLLNPILRNFWTTPEIRYRILFGGRASSKTYDAAGMAVFLASQVKIRFLCLRQFQNKIDDSVYEILEDRIDAFNMNDQFEFQKTTIKHKNTGSEFLFKGIARNIKEIKGLQGIDITWIEEAEDITKEQMRVIEPTILRKDGSQLWIVFNPRYATDFVWQKYVADPPAKALVHQINYNDNPFLTKSMLEVIEEEKRNDQEEFEHVYLGIPMESDGRAIIKRSWIMAAIDAHKELDGEWFGGINTGFDVADSGADTNANTVMDGSVCVALDEWKGGEDELVKSTTRTLGNANAHGGGFIGYDSIGVGASSGSILRDKGFHNHFRFNAGSKVYKPNRKYKNTGITNNEFFSNLKAQAWWIVADRFLNTYKAVRNGEKFTPDEMISISSECDAKLLKKLIEELSTPEKDFDNTGKVKVESKKDLAKRDVKSPNIADSFIIANSRGISSAAVDISQLL